MFVRTANRAGDHSRVLGFEASVGRRCAVLHILPLAVRAAKSMEEKNEEDNQIWPIYIKYIPGYAVFNWSAQVPWSSHCDEVHSPTGSSHHFQLQRGTNLRSRPARQPRPIYSRESHVSIYTD